MKIKLKFILTYIIFVIVMLISLFFGSSFENWLKNKDNQQIIDYFNLILNTPLTINMNELSSYNKERLISYIDKYFLSNISMSKETQFYLIMSPVNQLELARRIRAKNQFFIKEKELFKYLVNISTKYKNLKIYAFNNDPNLIQIEDYKDGIHCKYEITLHILDSINSDKYELNSNNLSKYIDDVHNISLNFDYEKYYYQIRTVMK